MAQYASPVGMQSAIFIGTAGASGVLTRMSVPTTGGINIIEDIPTEYVQFLDSEVQSGYHAVSITLPFLGDDETVYKISRKQPLEQSDYNADPVAGTKYDIFIVYPDLTTPKSYILYNMYVTSQMTLNYNKDRATVLAVQFRGVARSYATDLILRGNTRDLAVSLGSKNPLPHIS